MSMSFIFHALLFNQGSHLVSTMRSDVDHAWDIYQQKRDEFMALCVSFWERLSTWMERNREE